MQSGQSHPWWPKIPDIMVLVSVLKIKMWFIKCVKLVGIVILKLVFDVGVNDALC